MSLWTFDEVIELRIFYSLIAIFDEVMGSKIFNYLYGFRQSDFRQSVFDKVRLNLADTYLKYVLQNDF